jgi:hypothetical protein
MAVLITACTRQSCPTLRTSSRAAAGAVWVDQYVSAPRPPSPLPPDFPSYLEDHEIIQDGVVTGKRISDHLPRIEGDAWHADPEKHWNHVDRWEEMQESMGYVMRYDRGKNIWARE